jgi:hypothetical protein
MHDHDDIHHFALIVTREPKPVKVRGGAQSLTVGFDFSGDSVDEILYFDPFDLIAGKKVQILRAAVVEVKQPQGAATREEKALLLREPSAEKISLPPGERRP